MFKKSLLLFFLAVMVVLPAAGKEKNSFYNQEFTFFNIVPGSVGKEKETAALMLDYYKRTGNTVLLYSVPMQPVGNDVNERPRRLLESYRKLKKHLAGTPLRLGVLIQSMLGHGWVNPCNVNWQRSITSKGNLKRFCPEDPGFKEYIYKTVKMFAEEKPCFIMTDDDMRAFNGGFLCLCPLHNKIFNERTGKKHTFEQFRDAVINSKKGDKVFNIFLKMQHEYVDGVLKIVRKAIDDVDPTIPGGVCMPGWESAYQKQRAAIVAGKGNPLLIRLANANYEEGSPKVFPFYIARTLAYRKYYADVEMILDESDTFPHTRYSRSARSMHAKLCSGIFSGLRGSKIWCINSIRYNRVIDQEYTDILAKYRNFYQVLAAESAKSTTAGVIQPASRNLPNWHFTSTGERFLIEPNFISKYLGTMGIPFDTDFDLGKNEVYILSKAAHVNRFTDAELKKMFAGKLFIDGPAAAELTKRGFAKYMGVSVKEAPLPNGTERWTDTQEPIRALRTTTCFCLNKINKNTRTLTEFVIGDQKTAPATTFFVNKLGGRVAVTSYHDDIKWIYHHPTRKDWLVRVFETVKGEKLPFYMPNYQDVVMLHRRSSDKSDLLFLANVNFDPIENIRVACAKTPASVAILTPCGKWKQLKFTVKGNEIILPERLECYEVKVLKVR